MIEDSDSPAENSTTVQKIALEEIEEKEAGQARLFDDDLDLIQDVKVQVTVSVGKATLTVKELFALREGSLLQLNKNTSEPVDLLLDGKLVARGELVAVEDDFGVRIAEIVKRPNS